MLLRVSFCLFHRLQLFYGSGSLFLVFPGETGFSPGVSGTEDVSFWEETNVSWWDATSFSPDAWFPQRDWGNMTSLRLSAVGFVVGSCYSRFLNMVNFVFRLRVFRYCSSQTPNVTSFLHFRSIGHRSCCQCCPCHWASDLSVGSLFSWGGESSYPEASDEKFVFSCRCVIGHLVFFVQCTCRWQKWMKNCLGAVWKGYWKHLKLVGVRLTEVGRAKCCKKRL